MRTEFTVSFVLFASSNPPLAMLRLRERNRGRSTPFITRVLGIDWEFSGSNIVRVRLENAYGQRLPRPLRMASIRQVTIHATERYAKLEESPLKAGVFRAWASNIKVDYRFHGGDELPHVFSIEIVLHGYQSATGVYEKLFEGGFPPVEPVALGSHQDFMDANLYGKTLEELVAWATSRHIHLSECDKQDAQRCRATIIGAEINRPL